MNNVHKPVGAIFDAAMELPREQRAACVQEACAGDDLLRQRVEALLSAHESAGTFMDSLAVAPTRRTSVAKPSEQAGDMIGCYKLLQQIGEGGCGVVYMAEQMEPVRRKVALKVIKLGMDTKEVISRFEAERQALALMDHPSIAKVLEAGATDTGRPYFVMELVRGVKITDYCDENNLSTVARLELFIQVCHAIQHAHQRNVIHRDIKPSNILVTVNDGVAVPKVIDFGIAKATQGRLTDHTLFTAFEQFLGTPAYMSPEQAVMTSLDIDTRSDIYSLGALLYELLTSHTPFDAKELLKAGLDEIRRKIGEQEPTLPSTRLSTMLGADLKEIAKHRKAEPLRLIQSMRGDLDWIVMKALEKDRSRRYATAYGLATDIQRYLSDKPVAARPPSRLYRFQKLIQRNKALFIAAGITATVLIIGLTDYTRILLKERQSRQNGAIGIINAPNLLGYWRFDSVFQGNSCVNGHTGTLQGNARIGPPGSGPHLKSDLANQALLLDGSNSYLTTSLTGGIGNEGTVLVWIYLTAQPSTVGHIFTIIAQSHFRNDFTLLIHTNNYIYFFTDRGSATVSPQALSLNQWHFLAATFAVNSTRSIYVDGELVASSLPGPHAVNNNPLWIGNDQVFGPRYFQGRIDEAAIFDRSLTASEIASVQNAAQW